jgi:hypothetical protein
MALESLNALDNFLGSPSNDMRQVITEAALLSNAVILYARGTKTTSRERKNFDLISKFTDEEKTVHAELCDLRDSAIAHFGSGGSYRGEWQVELVVLQFKDGEGKPGVATRRKAIDKLLLQRARKQIETAHAFLRSEALAKLGEVTVELNRAAEHDPEFYKEFEQHPLNLPIFLASPNAAQAAFDAFEVGYAKGTTRHG